MYVANGNRQSIGCVERLGSSLQFEQSADHLLYLLLFGTSVSCNSALNLKRRILEDRDIRLRGGKQADTSDVSQAQRALNIIRIEETFKSGGMGFEFANDVDNTPMNLLQADSQRIRRLRTDGAAADKNAIGTVRIDDAITGDSGPAINAKDPHHT
jgi:hypothetical protein